MRTSFFGLLISTALFFTAPAATNHIERWGVCYKLGGAVALFFNESPRARLIGYYKGREAAFMINRFNDLEPKTNAIGDMVMVYYTPRGRFVAFVIAHRGCLNDTGQISKGIYLMWIGKMSRLET